MVRTFINDLMGRKAGTMLTINIEFKLKIDIHYFGGNLGINKFLDYIDNVEAFP